MDIRRCLIVNWTAQQGVNNKFRKWTLTRLHHCRQCGRVVCHDCSSRSLVLPQLGYTKAVRVCSGCFEVAYLVAYVLADDLGPTTQIHGARGLYDIVEGENERAIQNVLDHGGLDAMVFLCRLNHNYELHALATSFLATLTDKGDHMHMRIVNKRAMPNLYHLVTFYGLVQQQQQQQQQMPYGSSPPNGSPTRSSPSVTAHAINPTPMPLTRMGSLESVHTRTTKRIETVTLIMMNVTHVIFRMVSSNKELSRQLARDGGLDSLMTLSVYFPAGVRTRAMDNALRTMAQQSHPQQQQQHPSVPQRPSSAMSSLSVSYHELHSERSSASGRGSSLDLSEVPGGGSAVDEDDEDNLLIHMDEWFHQRLEGMQQLAAKSISIMASDAITQAYIVDDPERVDRLLQLLYSNNPDVVKYAAKTTAFLSLRNDKHKTNLVRGAGVAALLMVIRLAREQHFIEAAEHDDGYQLTSATATEGVSRRSSSSPSIGSGNNSNMGGPRLPSEAVSHACCTLANLATNIESQEVLMSHPDLIDATCGVVGLYPSQTEVERHVARLLANLALYDQNKLCMLTDHSTMYGQSTATKPSTSHPYRYSSPSPPPLLRTMGNVVPTLMYIGAMTLELPSYMPGFQDPLDPYHARHPAAVIPDNFELAASLQEPFEVPELPSKESGDEYDVPTSHHHHHHHHHPASYTSYGTSPRHPGFAPSSASPSSHTLTATTMAAAMAHSPIIPAEVWRTVPGTEDIQRHFIRAIDNLLTTPATTPTGPMTPGVVAGGPFGTHSIFDPSEFVNEQTFQVFLKLWPTTSLIVAIRAATRDEDTQRRATHVLRTLKQQRMAHRAFVERFMMAYPASSSVPSQHQQQEQQREEEEEEEEEEEDVRRGDEVEEEKEQEDRRHAAAAEEEERRRIQQQEEEEAEAAAKLKEQQEQEQQEQQRKKAEEEEARRKQEEEAEIKRREEEERRQREQAEKEKAEEERRRQEQEEIERQEEERRQKEAEEKGRLEKEAEEKARLEKEAEEKARLEKEAEERERLKKEAEEKERLEKEAEEKERLEKEAEEKARLKKEAEEKARLEKEAKEKAEQARKKKEKEEMEQEEEQRRKNEAKLAQKEEEARLEKQEKERERIQQNLAKLRKKLEEERLQNQSKDGHESTDTSATGDEMSTTEDEAPSRSVTPAPGGSSSEKTKSSSKDKDKKKKKKKSK
ncbi:hypothetical protein BGZ73_006512 [Actinomortierella ambigua]|nr:hypothetical protein BGZ73_006512 [Actinomortierella ambigua]